MKPSIRRMVPVPIKLPDGVELGTTMVTFHNLRDGREHLAVVVDYPDETVPLVRLHSECMTGDLFGSQRCDCGWQLREALHFMADQGGILLYLRQEGRDVGLYSKLDSYDLQDGGLDTFEANRRLRYPEDPRDYGAAADMLRALGVAEIRLLSNNPDKVRQLADHGLTIAEVVATGVYASPHNMRYLAAKVARAGRSLTRKSS